MRPAKSATMASRLFVMRLNSVDLPTLGRPTRAMTGFMRQASRSASSLGRKANRPPLRVTTSMRRARTAPACRRPALPSVGRRSSGSPLVARQQVHLALAVAEHHASGRPPAARSGRGTAASRSSRRRRRWRARQAVMRSVASAPTTSSASPPTASMPPTLLRPQQRAALGIDAAHGRLEGARADHVARRAAGGPTRSARRSTSLVPRGVASGTSQRTVPRSGSTPGQARALARPARCP